jgi:hypothetical protein
MSRRERPNVVFSGAQTAGVINNIAGDQVNYGTISGAIGSVDQRLADVDEIRRLLGQVPLSDEERADAEDAVDRLEAEMSEPEPNRPAAAHVLEDLTAILKSAGALAGAGLALIDPIGRIAIALGGAAAAVLRAIGR